MASKKTSATGAGYKKGKRIVTSVLHPALPESSTFPICTLKKKHDIDCRYGGFGIDCAYRLNCPWKEIPKTHE